MYLTNLFNKFWSSPPREYIQKKLNSKQCKYLQQNDKKINPQKFFDAYQLAQQSKNMPIYSLRKIKKIYQAENYFYQGFEIDNTIKVYLNYFVSGLAWGTNTISRLNITGINSSKAAMVKQGINTFIAPTVGSFYDMLVGAVGNKFILNVMPELDKNIKDSPLYTEIIYKFNHLYNEFNNPESAMTHEEFSSKFTDINQQLERQNASNKFAFYGLGGILRSISNIIIISTISGIVTKKEELTIQQNIGAILGGFAGLCLASGLDRILQQVLTVKYNLECGDLFSDEANERKKNDPQYQYVVTDISQEKCKKFLKFAEQIEYEQVIENAEYKLVKLVKKNDINSTQKSLANLSNFAKELITLKFGQWGNLDLEGSIAKSLISKKSLFLHNLPANWFKEHAILSQFCKNYGNLLQAGPLSPLFWSIFADIARYAFANKVVGLKIFAIGKVLAGIILALSNLLSSSERKAVQKILHNKGDEELYSDKNGHPISHKYKLQYKTEDEDVGLVKYDMQYNRLVSRYTLFKRLVYGIGSSTTPLFRTPYYLIKIKNLKSKLEELNNYTIEIPLTSS